MKLSATIALGTARLIKERLPVRIGSDGRVLPTGAAAVHLVTSKYATKEGHEAKPKYLQRE